MITLNDDIKAIVDAMKEYPQVDAIAFAGSRAVGNCDEKSDYDVYIYSNGSEVLPEEVRNELYRKYCSRYETANQYFETEDNIVMNCGVAADILFRTIEDQKNLQEQIIDKGIAWLGYTTAFWHTLKVSVIYCDKSGALTALQKKYDIPYPQQLKKNIITKNMNMLSGVLPSYDEQIKKAVKRNDVVSICHRTAAFMESYFDVIFALNEMTHPGEKRLVSICKSQCSILPKDFEENINKLYSSMYSGYDFATLNAMYTNLKELVEANI